MPENLAVTTAPVSTSPDIYDPHADIALQWDAVSGSPTNIGILIESGFTQAGDNYIVTLANSATTHIIPAETINADESAVPINVAATNSAVLLGTSFQFGSIYNVANAATFIITTGS